MMDESMLREMLIAISSAMRLAAGFAAVIAIYEVSRRFPMSMKAKSFMMFVLFCFAFSAASSAARLSGQPTAMLTRELGHMALSVALISLAGYTAFTAKPRARPRCDEQCSSQSAFHNWPVQQEFPEPYRNILQAK